VPDQRTADRVVAALDADPDRYAQLAERFAGDFTLAEPRPLPLEQVPPPLADQAAAAEPGTAFAVAVPETGGIVVGFVGPAPTFEELRPQLQQSAEEEVDQEAQGLVEKVRQDLDVEVNPRYGDLQDDGQVQPADAGVVKLLEG
jgi:peptidyl-prolyl cis-trans isomerase SurA